MLEPVMDSKCMDVCSGFKGHPVLKQGDSGMLLPLNLSTAGNLSVGQLFPLSYNLRHLHLGVTLYTSLRSWAWEI